MSDYEFPQELIERCGHAAWVSRLQALRVLRESGHAEMVAALKDIERGKQSLVDSELVEHFQAIARAALRKAGAQ